MRRSEKEIRNPAVVDTLLRTAPVGRLGTVNSEGYAMIKPLNFVYERGRIYFHTALRGEKIDDIQRDSRVVFELDLPIAYVKGDNNPCGARYRYRSVIIRGRAALLQDATEKVHALKSLMAKYQPEGGHGDFLEEKLAVTGVVRIDIEETTGKEDL